MQGGFGHIASIIILTVIERQTWTTQHSHSNREQTCRHNFTNLSVTLQVPDLDSAIAPGFPGTSSLGLHPGWATVSLIQRCGPHRVLLCGCQCQQKGNFEYAGFGLLSCKRLIHNDVYGLSSLDTNRKAYL